MSYLPVAAFAVLYLAATLRYGLPAWVGFGYLVASVLCFAAYAADKSAARARSRRTPERVLLMLGMAGGWPGAVLAQQWLRHKSAKTAFRLKFWATVLANVGVFMAAASLLGQS